MRKYLISVKQGLWVRASLIRYVNHDQEFALILITFMLDAYVSLERGWVWRDIFALSARGPIPFLVYLDPVVSEEQGGLCHKVALVALVPPVLVRRLKQFT